MRPRHLVAGPSVESLAGGAWMNTVSRDNAADYLSSPRAEI